LQFTDFKSFCKSNSGLQNFICQIQQSEWILKDSGIYEFHVASNRFLRGMVRLMVGTCLNYCSSKISLTQIQLSLSIQEQMQHSWSVPAKGLCLVSVKYPQEIMDQLNPL
jgi:tRNA pseudouridine38-40 synthase